VSVGLDSNLRLSGKTREPVEIVVTGQSVAQQQANPFVHVHVVSAGYFRALGVPIVRGRAFDDADRNDTQPVVVVGHRLAERLWPGEDPIGRRIAVRSAATNPMAVVVGVAGDVRQQTLAGTTSQ
jgi:putative ABC transport system permease protein